MKFLLNIVLVGMFTIHGLASANCRGALENLTVTENFIAYLDTLFEQNYILDPKMYTQTLLQDLEQSRTLSSPFLNLHSSNDVIQDNNFRAHITHPDLDRSILKLWLVQRLDEMRTTARQKNDSKEKTAKSRIEMKFHKINPGRVDKTLVFGTFTPYEIDVPFEMMETFVTQHMWTEIMDENPSLHKEDDHPVEMITWWSAAEYANRLSIKRGLKPVYDFSQITLWNGHPAEGTYYPKDLKDISLVKINAPNEDIYKAEGFRLPTDTELKLAIYRFDNRTDAQADLYQRSLLDYGWFRENSDSTTHPVAEKLPFIIDGNRFYDLYGNVSHWVHNPVPSSQHQIQQTGTNPQNPFKVATETMQLGSPSFLHSVKDAVPSGWSSNLDSNVVNVGFRLVRSLPKEKKP